MPAQRNTKPLLAKEQRKTKPEAPLPAKNVSEPIIRVRPPTPPTLLNLTELNDNNGLPGPADLHRQNGLSRLSPKPKHRLAVPKHSQGKAENGRPSNEELPLSGMPKISQKTKEQLGAEHAHNVNERGPSAKVIGTWKVQEKHLVPSVRASSVSRSTESVPAVLHRARGSRLV